MLTAICLFIASIALIIVIDDEWERQKGGKIR